MTPVFCPVCGTRGIRKVIGDEGEMQYCPTCERPLWDIFTTCIICAVVNEYDEIALIRQSYVSTANYVCVAGHMKAGESAEDTVIREVKEEIGLDVKELTFVHSYPYAKKDMLMLGYKARVAKRDFVLSGEVDTAEWFPLKDADSHLREGGIAWELVRTINGRNGSGK